MLPSINPGSGQDKVLWFFSFLNQSLIFSYVTRLSWMNTPFVSIESYRGNSAKRE